MTTLPEMHDLALVVDEIADLTPTLRAIWLSGAGDEFVYVPGQDVMISVPDGDATIRRRYTIRRIDERGRIEMWVLRHGHGPGAAWASRATAGEEIDAVGPRGKVVVVPDRAWHLFVADESGLAASLAMAETTTEGEAIVICETDAAADELATVAVRWIHRDGAAPGDNDLLERAIEHLELPAGNGHAYLSAEKATVKRLGEILERRGVDGDHRSPKGYWDHSRANAGHGEPAR
jgi:NADPH-dependent ferric siderophore reductase